MSTAVLRDTSQALDWTAILDEARPIVETYDTSVTLRQLFYRLVAAQLIPNTTNAYKSLSRYTAQARRAGTFPALMDRTRSIHRYRAFAGAVEAREWLARIYRRDRTEGQPVSLYLGVEKAGIVEQLQEWFGDLGVPVLALGGYGSQTYVDDVVEDVEASGRPAVLLYAGDHDPSGEDIDRDFVSRTGCWSEVRRVALTAAQVEEYNLPPQAGKTTDSRAAGFIARHGRLVQVGARRSPSRRVAGSLPRSDSGLLGRVRLRWLARPRARGPEGVGHTMTEPAVEPIEEHEHRWHVFSFEFPLTIGYRCECGAECFERPDAGAGNSARERRR
ncbi:MAG: hypothetical protein ACRD3V_31455 [Vicinamibacteria bacterium]